MRYRTEEIAAALKAAREQKGFSQRDLMERASVPQSHISKIENNSVDLRLSSLTAIAHALELELVLVPRKALPAVRALVQSSTISRSNDPVIAQEFKKLARAITTLPSEQEFAQLKSSFQELQFYQSHIKSFAPLKTLNKLLKEYGESKDPTHIQTISDMLKALRNNLVHGVHQLSKQERPKPAYQLEDDDDD